MWMDGWMDGWWDGMTNYVLLHIEFAGKWYLFSRIRKIKKEGSTAALQYAACCNVAESCPEQFYWSKVINWYHVPLRKK
jgi:hypothetical protein